MDALRTQFIRAVNTAGQSLGARRHVLELVSGIDAGRRFPIDAAGSTIGRVAADIVIAAADVSRTHCRVAVERDALVVDDLGSTNGTFVDGARVASRRLVPVGAILQVGHQFLKHELLTGKQLEVSQALDRDIAAAFSYVQALLPPPLRDGPIRAEWVCQPCARLGGDAFGYFPLADGRFVIYLIDVSGHGTGAAMHSVSVMNLLRQQALPATDMGDAAAVLATLNGLFQMDRHADMYFTMWYGVYAPATRRLDFASAGHHAAFLVDAQRATATPLRTRSVIVGAAPDVAYRSASVAVPPGASIYLFSDGVFEIVTSDGAEWTLADFVPLLLAPPAAGATEAERLFGAVRGAARAGELDDDFALVVLTID